MRVEELRNVIRDVGGILPALQRLSYAGMACIVVYTVTAPLGSASRQLPTHVVLSLAALRSGLVRFSIHS